MIYLSASSNPAQQILHIKPSPFLINPAFQRLVYSRTSQHLLYQSSLSRLVHSRTSQPLLCPPCLTDLRSLTNPKSPTSLRSPAKDAAMNPVCLLILTMPREVHIVPILVRAEYLRQVNHVRNYLRLALHIRMFLDPAATKVKTHNLSLQDFQLQIGGGKITCLRPPIPAIRVRVASIRRHIMGLRPASMSQIRMRLRPYL